MNLAKEIWALELGIMKNQLKIGEFRFGGKDNDSFKYFKEQTMDHFYEATKKFFIQNSGQGGIFERCSCSANLRHGWDINCSDCSGSGFRDKKSD
jgi:hypothetical protein